MQESRTIWSTWFNKNQEQYDLLDSEKSTKEMKEIELKFREYQNLKILLNQFSFDTMLKSDTSLKLLQWWNHT